MWAPEELEHAQKSGKKSAILTVIRLIDTTRKNPMRILNTATSICIHAIHVQTVYQNSGWIMTVFSKTLLKTRHNKKTKHAVQFSELFDIYFALLALFAQANWGPWRVRWSLPLWNYDDHERSPSSPVTDDYLWSQCAVCLACFGETGVHQFTGKSEIKCWVAFAKLVKAVALIRLLSSPAANERRASQSWVRVLEVGSLGSSLRLGGCPQIHLPVPCSLSLLVPFDWSL